MSIPATQPHAPGWYPDPTGRAGLRRWDGQERTGRRSIASRGWALAAVLARFVVRRLSWRALLYHAGRE